MEDKKTENNYGWRNRVRSAIYPMAGVYLAYLAYSMFKKISVTSGSEQMLMVVFTILFAIIGLALILTGLIMGYRMNKEMRDAGKRIEEQKELQEHVKVK